MTPKKASKYIRSDISGFASDENYFRAHYMAISALEKADKYRWHDLRKNPYDLPPHGRNVIVLTEGFGIGASIYTHTIGHWNKDKGKWRFDSVAYPIPIAWKEIEPFEEVNE